MNSRKRFGIATAIAGVALTLGGLAVSSTPAGATVAPGTISLNNTSASSGTDCPDATNDYWHFVITPNSGFAFVSISLNVGGSTFNFNGFPPIIPNGTQHDNVFVKVPAGFSLTDLQSGTAVATPEGATKFTLSHTCNGTPATTTTTMAPTTTMAATTTTAAATTTTMAATTTTAAATTTTEAATTTTEAATTTTEAATTTTEAATTTTEAATTTTAAATTTTVGETTTTVGETTTVVANTNQATTTTIADTTTTAVDSGGPTTTIADTTTTAVDSGGPTTTIPGATTTLVDSGGPTTTVFSPGLPTTGSNNSLLVTIGLLMILGGIVSLALGRRADES